MGEEHVLAERVKVSETEALPRLVTVTVTETALPAGTHEGAVQRTSLVVPVLETTPRVPREAVHEKLSWGDSSS
jgi:hypothetical protein